MAKKHKQKKTVAFKENPEPLTSEAGQDFFSKVLLIFNRIPVVVFIIVIILACLIIYLRTLSYGFSHYDDDVMVMNNLPFLKDFSNIPEAFVRDAWFLHKRIELYRPLQSVSYIIDAHIGDDIVFATHLTSMILHILCCIAVFYLLMLFKFERKYAFLGAMVYSVHYLLLHTVIWIPARGDLLLALFTFLSVITFIHLVRSGKWYFYVLNILSFAFAIFSKETALMLPLLYIIYFLLFERKKMFRTGNWILATFYIIIVIVFYYLRDLSVDKQVQQLGIGQFFQNLQTIPETIQKLFVPVNFCTMPVFNATATILGLLVIAGFTALFLIRRKLFNPLVLFSILWFALFLIPGMIYRPYFTSFSYEYLDHRAYLPTFGAFMVILSLVRDYEKSSANALTGKIIMICSLLVLVYLGFMNYILNPVYKDAISYSESAIAHNKSSSQAYFIHGCEMQRLKKEDAALADFSNALKYNPNLFEARYNRAVILYNKDRYQETLNDLDYIVQNKADYGFDVYSLRGGVRYALKDYNGARLDFEEALKYKPDDKETLKNLEILKNEGPQKLNKEGMALAQSGKYQEALELFESAYTTDTTFYDVLVNIGNCRLVIGDRAGACEAWRKAAQHGVKGAQGMINNYCGK
mgnify:CR=1 FL=1